MLYVLFAQGDDNPSDDSGVEICAQHNADNLPIPALQRSVYYSTN